MTYTYNAVNRLTNAGYAYDAAGRMTGDGTNTYTWDRADRLLSVGNTSTRYNGNGQRVEQTVSGTTTRYLLDVLNPLWQTLAATTGASTTRYLHGTTGLARQQDTAGAWLWTVQDALGSIRSMVSSANAPVDIRQYAPYGEPTQLGGTAATVYGFTGEPTDTSGLVYLRARYMRPGIAAFLSLDPVVEGNRYGYVGGNPVMWTDPSGRVACMDPYGDCRTRQRPKPPKQISRGKTGGISLSDRVRGTNVPNPSGVKRDTCDCAAMAYMDLVVHCTIACCQKPENAHFLPCREMADTGRSSTPPGSPTADPDPIIETIVPSVVGKGSGCATIRRITLIEPVANCAIGDNTVVGLAQVRNCNASCSRCNDWEKLPRREVRFQCEKDETGTWKVIDCNSNRFACN
jgi:RHS repeat-associated protein